MRASPRGPKCRPRKSRPRLTNRREQSFLRFLLPADFGTYFRNTQTAISSISVPFRRNHPTLPAVRSGVKAEAPTQTARIRYDFNSHIERQTCYPRRFIALSLCIGGHINSRTTGHFCCRHDKQTNEGVDHRTATVFNPRNCTPRVFQNQITG